MATIQEALTIAVQHYHAGQLQAAEGIYQQILQADPNVDAAWNGLGMIAYQSRQYASALQCLGRAVAIAPGVAAYHDNLGVAFLAVGQPSEAEACFRQALSLNPALASAANNLAQLSNRPVYPMNVPPMRVRPGLDFLLLLLPPRYLPMMPNGAGYLHNALLKTSVHFQTIDASIIMYHRYHQRRVLGNATLATATGYAMKGDPWAWENLQEWEREDVLDFFWPELADVIAQIVANPPKSVGLSVHASNRLLARKFIAELRAAAPQVLIILGGYDCVYPEIGPQLYKDFDYMAIDEADLTVGPLMTAIAAGERPKDMPGIISRYDTPGRVFQQPPRLQDLDSVDYPRYQWAPAELYQTFDRRKLVPLTGSRGCVWARCRFCRECLPFRCRSPIRLADEIEDWVNRGVSAFTFNESDVNGNPAALYELCSEIIRRGLKIHMDGQLRIHKKSTLEYFQHLKKAGFAYLRFGVDAWNDHTLKLQRKGYAFSTVVQNLRDSFAAGVVTVVNMVIGVPGETEQDIDEMIQNLIQCKPHFHRVEYINTLMLTGGSEYLRNPDEYNIRFRGDKETILREHRNVIPVELWYSEDPYIDQEVRVKRVDRICAALQANHVPLGSYPLRLLERWKQPGAYLDADGEVRVRSQPAGAAGAAAS